MEFKYAYKYKYNESVRQLTFSEASRVFMMTCIAEYHIKFYRIT